MSSQGDPALTAHLRVFSFFVKNLEKIIRQENLTPQGALGSLAVDLTGAKDADGNEPAHKVHAGGPKKAKPTDLSTFDHVRTFVQYTSETWCRPTSTTRSRS